MTATQSLKHLPDLINTGFTDDNHSYIFVGDILQSKDGYKVLVCQDDNGALYGSLICPIGHSCRNIPYALNKGKGYTKIA